MTHKMFSLVTWLIVAGLTIFLLLLLLEPGSGSDPSTRGIGTTLKTLIISAIVLIIVLQFLPFGWSKYLGFILGIVMVIVIIIFLLAMSGSSLLFQDTRTTTTESPGFEDPVLNGLDDALQKNDVETWKKLLNLHPEYVRNTTLFNHLLLEVNYNGTSEPAKLACLTHLFELGATFDKIFIPQFSQIASSGNAAMVELLVQHGADPNAIDDSMTPRPLIFNTLDGYGKTDEVISVLIKHGADPNVKLFDPQLQDSITPLLYAVMRENWLCGTALLENGADAHYKSKDGLTIKDRVLRIVEERKEEDRGTKPDFWEFVKRLELQSSSAHE